ncbi:MAG TPA: methanol dehydrogenase, partial [Burkholderiales bacterium]|nr:methanol dehydrogenase [Burkholderiales bacterium]
MRVLRYLVILSLSGFFGTAIADEPLYTVVDGYKVDPDTLTGFKTWRAAACDRCHGANQEGL